MGGADPPGSAGKVRSRSTAFLVTAVAAAAVLGFGIFRKEIGEVLLNAALL